MGDQSLLHLLPSACQTSAFWMLLSEETISK